MYPRGMELTIEPYRNEKSKEFWQPAYTYNDMQLLVYAVDKLSTMQIELRADIYVRHGVPDEKNLYLHLARGRRGEIAWPEIPEGLEP